MSDYDVSRIQRYLRRSWNTSENDGLAPGMSQFNEGLPPLWHSIMARKTLRTACRHGNEGQRTEYNLVVSNLRDLKVLVDRTLETYEQQPEPQEDRHAQFSEENLKRELHELSTRYEGVGLEGSTIIALSEKSVIQEVEFGVFRMKLLLTDQGNSLSAEALNPVYSEGQEGFTHPHVGISGSLCLGAGKNAYKLALREGRLADVFDIANAVLTSYGYNPYCEIERWTSSTRTCGICSHRQENPSRCHRCRMYTCESHTARCHDCGVSLCRDCSNLYSDSHGETHRLCVSCYKRCDQCRNIVPLSELRPHGDANYCQSCHDSRQPNYAGRFGA